MFVRMTVPRRCRAALFLGLSLTLLLAGVAHAARDTNPFLDYRRDRGLLPQTPSVTGGPVAGLFNPAAFALSDVGGADLWWNDGNVRGGLDNYGFALGHALNFAMNTSTYGDRTDNHHVTDYQLGVAGGGRANTFGVAYRWARGGNELTPREKALVVGAASRRRSWLSFGAAGVFSLESGASQYTVDLGLRPFDQDYLTLFADWTVNDDEAFLQDGSWTAGLEVRPLDGLHLGLRAGEHPDTGELEYSALAGLTIGLTNLAAMADFNEDGDHERMRYLVRSSPPMSGRGPVVLKRSPAPRYYALSLENKVLTYQKYRLFDDKRIAWLDLLPLLNALRDEDDLDLLVINLAGCDGRPSLLWEFRQKLQEIQAAGKRVIVHTDRTNARTYYLASVADEVSIDPQGSISIPGLSLTRSYLAGTLEKLGLGFQEHRYFKYKSAAETLSRDSMSEADREQRQRVVDVIYEEMRDGVAQGRGLAPERVDHLTDEMGLLVAGEAEANGLVDRIGRWDGLLKDLREEQRGKPLANPPSQYPRRFWDDQWGQPVKIPVVYAVGSCAMDSGIKGRRTSAYLRSLVRDPDVKAVVLRADSPGGDPLPSDLVAEAVRQLKEAGKPVIISQGDVAASGGYWISMDGTEVLTTPLTVTGSIGVISGWLWDDGFAASAGVSSESVQRGRHADLYSNVNLPFLGGIPRRPMNDEELARVETVIRGMYTDFVDAVAAGRGLDTGAVQAIAQGRVWMGGDAIANGLCDRFGTLDDAINTARAAAGVPDWQEVQIVEYPPRPLFKWPSFGPRLPRLFGLGSQVNAGLAHLAGLAAGADEAAGPAPELLGAPGLSVYDVEFLQGLVRTRGGASLQVAPDLLPEAWQRND